MAKKSLSTDANFVDKVLGGVPVTEDDINPKADDAIVEATDREKSDLEQELIVSSGKVKTGTVARLIVLLVTLINELLNTLGIYSALPINSGVIDMVSLGLVIAASFWCYWKNNSWSAEATVGDVIMKSLKEGELSLSDIFEILAEAAKKNNK